MSKQINGAIYLFTLKGTSRHYIGQTTTSVKRRYQKHVGDSRKANPKSAIGAAIKKHGIEQFSFCILQDNISDWKILNELEIAYIAKYDSYHNGFNRHIGGQEEFRTNQAWGHTEEIARLYTEKLMTIQQIADLYECSTTPIYDILKSMDITIRDNKRETWGYSEEIARLYTEKLISSQQIADLYECSRHVISDILKSMGIKMRPGGCPKGNHSDKKHEAWDHSEVITRLYTQEFMTTYQIAGLYECDRSVISDILKSQGVKMRSRFHRAWKHSEEIARLYTEKLMTAQQIASLYECSPSVIRDILKSMDILIRNNKHESWNHCEEIARLYTEELMSTQQIADLYECDKSVICDILKSMGVKMRPPGRSTNKPRQACKQLFLFD